ncbi:glycosyltransferase [Lentimicrobium sp. S6]|uniref:glycosyltransferase n=1 Tax=Lentimicrobium sp. S6 TaxID=2735872 RepID=UPI001552E54F|nr:glycosyltransferase [Lentimicrobium sp. S6]NPD44596.1 glycosyltransferase [Lentimicrobium sp. S6]
MKLGQMINQMGKQQRYLLFGDGNSPHTLKWVKELILHYDVFVVSSSQVSESLKKVIPAEKREALGVEVQAEGNTLGYFKKIFKLNSIIKRIQPEIVNAHYISSHGFLIALVKQFGYSKFKFVASAWGTDVLVFPFRNKVFFRIMKFVLSKADYITSDSNHMSKVIQQIKNKPVITFTFGLDEMPDFNEYEKEASLYFSNRALSENYNIGEVIRAFQSIAEEDLEARLVVSNEGADKENLVWQVVELGLTERVEFVGFLSAEEQAKVYSKSSFYFSLPSSDSTSVSLLEALAYGCIPILSDIPANREWVKNAENGILIEKDIDLKLINKLRNNRMSIIRFNRKQIEERGIFPKLMNDFVEIIK